MIIWFGFMEVLWSMNYKKIHMVDIILTEPIIRSDVAVALTHLVVSYDAALAVAHLVVIVLVVVTL